MIKVKDPSELSEYSWTLINEAVQDGKITLNNAKSYELDVETIIRLIQWTATLKAKKPHAMSKPEDFTLKATTGEDDENQD